MPQLSLKRGYRIGQKVYSVALLSMTSTPYRDYLRLLAQLNFPIKNLSLPDLPIYILRFSALPLISSIFLRLFEATGLKGVNIIL